jgi:hypothetical protein
MLDRLQPSGPLPAPSRRALRRGGAAGRRPTSGLSSTATCVGMGHISGPGLPDPPAAAAGAAPSPAAASHAARAGRGPGERPRASDSEPTTPQCSAPSAGSGPLRPRGASLEKSDAKEGLEGTSDRSTDIIVSRHVLRQAEGRSERGV